MTRFAPFALLALATVASAEVPQSVKDALAEADAGVARIVATPVEKRSWETTFGAYDDVTDTLYTKVSTTTFLQHVHPDEKVRQDSRDAEEAVTNWLIALGKNEALFRTLSGPMGVKEELTAPQARLREFTLRDYRRSGMALSAEKRARLKAIEERIAKLGQEFSKNIAEDKTALLFTEAELKGVTLDRIDAKPVAGGYEVKLGSSSYTALMTEATDAETRKRAYVAYKSKAAKPNVPILEEVLRLRNEAARLLGYPSTAAYETEIRMAKSPKGVADFYKKLRPIVRKKAKADYAEFLALKKTLEPGSTEMFPWDQMFVKSKLMETKYAVDDAKVAEYFPAAQTVKGLLDVSSKLYGVEFVKQADASLWHPDAEKYTVLRNGQKIGEFFMDLFPRENKYNHAACWNLVNRRRLPDGTVQLPVAALVCNFTKPTADKPSLLTHDEVSTLFHEFGHGLHNLLTTSEIGRFSGTAVELDFVEAPSQMFENWVWDAGVLATFAKHYKTGEPLPKSLLDGMLAAKTVGSGLETEHQIYYGLVDQRFHTAKGGIVDTTPVAVKMLGEIELYRPVPGTAYQASFGHLMGYQAGYYSYLWSLVYAADMFERFRERGLLNPEAGRYYVDKVIGVGGQKDASVMLRDYLGREPRFDAFLTELGLRK